MLVTDMKALAAGFQKDGETLNNLNYSKKE